MKTSPNGPLATHDSTPRVHFNYLLRVGDSVTMAVHSADEGWGKQPVPNGVSGTVVGFERFNLHVARNSAYSATPGVYSCNGVPLVAWNSGVFSAARDLSVLCLSSDIDAPVALAGSLLESRREDTSYRRAWETDFYVGPLPKTAFYEGDTVKASSEEAILFAGEKDMQVLSINYHYIGEKRDDGSDMPWYTVSLPNGGTTSFGESDLSLVDRGFYWRWFEEKPQLPRQPLKNFSLLANVGACVEVRSPVSDMFTFDKKEALAGVHGGLGDFFTHVPGQFNFHLFKMKPEFQHLRVRELFLEALKQGALP